MAEKPNLVNGLIGLTQRGRICTARPPLGPSQAPCSELVETKTNSIAVSLAVPVTDTQHQLPELQGIKNIASISDWALTICLFVPCTLGVITRPGVNYHGSFLPGWTCAPGHPNASQGP